LIIAFIRRESLLWILFSSGERISDLVDDELRSSQSELSSGEAVGIETVSAFERVALSSGLPVVVNARLVPSGMRTNDSVDSVGIDPVFASALADTDCVSSWLPL
jgi:hypothetical protein